MNLPNMSPADRSATRHVRTSETRYLQATHAGMFDTGDVG